MTWSYSYTPVNWPTVFTILLLITLTVYSGRRRSVPGALPLMIACLFATAWAIGSVMEYAAQDLATKIFWVLFQAVWHLPIITAITCFFLEYAWPGRWLTRRNLILLSIPCLLAAALVLSNELHHLIWLDLAYENKVIRTPGPVTWILIAYAFVGLGLLNLIVFAWLFRRSQQHRWPVVIMLAGQIVGRIDFALSSAGMFKFALPIDVLGMAFEFLVYAFALFGFRILNPALLAQRTAIQQLRAGMLVLDPQGRVASLNSMAERIFRLPASQLLGQPVQTLLPDYPDELPATFLEAEIELCLKNGQESRYYTLEISPLNDWRGLAVGRLLMMRDVTEQKQSQAQILEQQRALAMLKEDEQLARELHDSLGQVLGYAHLTLEAARKLIADGKLTQADDHLAKLAGVMANAHADVREYILNLRTAPTEQQPFFTALQHYLNGYYLNYGIPVDLKIDTELDERILAPETQMQLFRILQEAFSNARQHAATNSLQVSFIVTDSRLHMHIQDNGQGFDPQQVANLGGGHFGLHIMRERAEQLGGCLRIETAPGKGTRVEVEVPV